jgi:hypothetical protein
VFIGHFAVGLATKRVAPQVSLGTLFMAAQFADLLWKEPCSLWAWFFTWEAPDPRTKLEFTLSGRWSSPCWYYMWEACWARLHRTSLSSRPQPFSCGSLFPGLIGLIVTGAATYKGRPARESHGQSPRFSREAGEGMAVLRQPNCFMFAPEATRVSKNLCPSHSVRRYLWRVSQ